MHCLYVCLSAICHKCYISTKKLIHSHLSTAVATKIDTRRPRDAAIIKMCQSNYGRHLGKIFFYSCVGMLITQKIIIGHLVRPG